ncbi:esterase-like activity of phytase family protein [Aquabacterium sp.]|uniref:esterase-like activity of phytase family protein n=1 Tax=Aquabacterium sp. TaxID=1872578 RepID=UPI0025BDC268|nr:esterase-like activity of phytase family protein [Aquabacterium sp.]
MNTLSRSALALLCAGIFGSAQAVDLIAVGQLSATASDLSGLSGKLESGAAANLLGGMGSGLAWAGGNTFLALPDRGPNANAWNSAVDDTTSYVPRFHTLQLVLSPATGGNLPYTLSATVTGTTLLYSTQPLAYGPVTPEGNGGGRYFFSGRSDNFDPSQSSANPFNARFDPEGIRVSRTGKTVFISDEYGPYVYQFDRATGARGRVFTLPANLAVTTLSAQGSVEIAGNTTGRVANKGMEGLAISPDGKTLFGFMQSPLAQDGGDGGRANRIVTIDVASGLTRQYAYDNYALDKAKAYNSSEILALNSHELLVLERDGKGLGDDSTASVKRVYKVDLAGAEDVSNLSGAAALLAKAPAKTLFLDIRAKLNAAGITDANIPAKLEGMAFGADIVVGGVTKHTLYIANDNDFIATTAGGKSNPNQWFVFTFTDADLGGSSFVNQTIAP